MNYLLHHTFSFTQTCSGSDLAKDHSGSGSSKIQNSFDGFFSAIGLINFVYSQALFVAIEVRTSQNQCV